MQLDIVNVQEQVLDLVGSNVCQQASPPFVCADGLQKPDETESIVQHLVMQLSVEYAGSQCAEGEEY